MKNNFVLHPFLFAIFPVIFLFAHGMGYVSFSETIAPAAVILFFTCFMLIMFRFVYRDLKKAGILVSTFMILFFSYGHIHDVVLAHGIIKSVMARNMLLLVAWSMILLLIGYTLLRTSKDLVNFTKLFNIMGIVLVVISLFNITMKMIKSSPQMDVARLDIEGLKIDNVEPNAGAKDRLPDIYYIVFDRYGNEGVLKNYYSFDNSEFVSYLTSKGFYVASQSTSNYINTSLSLASSLNMQYINDIMENMKKKSNESRLLFALIQDHAVFRFLKSKGYKYLHFGSWFQPTRKNKYADENYNVSLLPEFSMVLYRTTMIYPIGAKLRILDKRSECWKRIMYKFDKLAEIPNMKEPTFVFAHMIIPHYPYVFNADGTFLERHIEETRSRKRKYVDQVKFVNKKIRKLVDQLLSKSEIPPIIIIQADEGPYPDRYEANLSCFNWAKATNDELKEKMGILNALYLPDVDKRLLHPSMTQLNTFRIVFNCYFKTKMKLLPDENWVSINGSWLRILQNSSQGAQK
jgi:hypothetical protein